MRSSLCFEGVRSNPRAACLFSNFNPSLSDRSDNRLSQSLTDICSEVIERSRTRASESPVELFSSKVAKRRHYTQQRESPPQGGTDLKRGTSVKVFIFSKRMFVMLMYICKIFLIPSPSALTPNKFRMAGSHGKKGSFFKAVRFDPGMAGWEARTLPLCYTVPPTHM